MGYIHEVGITRKSTIESVADGVFIDDFYFPDVSEARNKIRFDTRLTAQGHLRIAEECYNNDKGYSNRVALIAARIEAR